MLSRIEAFTRRCFAKKLYSNTFSDSQEIICARVFFDKVVGVQNVTLLKRESGEDVFLLIMQNFPEQIFYGALAHGCFLLPEHESLRAKVSERKQ